MAYNNITFPTTGSYLIEYRVASAINGASLSADLNAGTIQLGAVNVPNTGAWQNWQTISQTVNVNAGTYNFGVYIQSSGVNLNWIRITKVGNALARQVVSEEEESILIYPNPVENTLNFSTDLKNTKLKIIDFQRGIYLELPINNDKSLDVSTLAPGIYAVVLEIEGQRITKKFVKK